MFIRARSYSTVDGRKGQSFSLIQSHRVDGTPRHSTLLNLGQDFSIPKEDWSELTQCVVSRLKGQDIPSCKEDDEAFQKALDHIVQQLQDKDYDVYAKPPDSRDTILTDEVRHTESRTVAGERMALEAMEHVELPQILRDLNLSETHIKLICALIAGRLIHPGSDQSTRYWMIEISSILDLLGMNAYHLSTVYCVLDRLSKHRQEIIDRIFTSTQDLLNFGKTIIFYELTNTFYDGEEDRELLHRRHRKERRRDCPLVTLVLVLNASGVPCWVKVVPGNASMPAALKPAMEELKGGAPTVIMDAGIATEEKLAYLRERGLDYVRVERAKTPPVPIGDPDHEFTTAGKKKIKAWRLPDQQEEQEAGPEPQLEQQQAPKEQRVYVHSEAKQYTEEQIQDTKCAKYEAALTNLHEDISMSGCLKELEKVYIQLGRLQEEHKNVSHLYEVMVTDKPGHRKGQRYAESLTFTRKVVHQLKCSVSSMSGYGGYVIRTARLDWTMEQVTRMYWRLTEIECVFRAMQSDLGLHPLYHRKNDRIDSHMFLTILAYHISHLIRFQLKQAGHHHSWDTIRTELNRMRRITTSLPKSKHRCMVTEIDQDLSPLLEEIFYILGFRYDPDETRTKTEYTEEKKPPKKHPIRKPEVGSQDG